MTVTAVLMMQSIAMYIRTQVLTALLLYFSLCTDCLQTLALCPVLPHHTDTLHQQDPLQEVLPGGPAEVSLHIAWQWWAHLWWKPQFYMHRWAVWPFLIQTIDNRQWRVYLCFEELPVPDEGITVDRMLHKHWIWTFINCLIWQHFFIGVADFIKHLVSVATLWLKQELQLFLLSALHFHWMNEHDHILFAQNLSWLSGLINTLSLNYPQFDLNNYADHEQAMNTEGMK